MVTGSTPILAVFDINETVAFYTDVLGFPHSWKYGDPPVFAGCSWGGATLMFGLEPDLAAKVEGHGLWLDVENVDDLYSSHIEKGAQILSPLEDKPWGFREYTVRDLNGYHIRFVGQIAHVSKGDGQFPEGTKIEVRMPTPEEFEKVTAAGFGEPPKPSDSLERSWQGVVAVSPDGDAIGVLRIVQDAPHWYSLWDVAVMPEWQGRRIGSKMMEAALDVVRQEAPGSRVYLFTFKGPFYERLGFEKQTHHSRSV